MRKFFNEEEKIISEINITPLTDVFLVLLIIFVVTTPMLIQSSIKVNLPKSAVSEEKIAEPLTITITRENKLYLNDKQIVSNEVLVNNLANELSKNKERMVIINADKEIMHGQVVDVLDAVKKAGAGKIAIGVESLQDNSAKRLH